MNTINRLGPDSYPVCVEGFHICYHTILCRGWAVAALTWGVQGQRLTGCVFTYRRDAVNSKKSLWNILWRQSINLWIKSFLMNIAIYVILILRGCDIVIIYCIFNRTSIALVRVPAVVPGDWERTALEEEGIHLKQNRKLYNRSYSLLRDYRENLTARVTVFFSFYLRLQPLSLHSQARCRRLDWMWARSGLRIGAGRTSLKETGKTRVRPFIVKKKDTILTA